MAIIFIRIYEGGDDNDSHDDNSISLPAGGPGVPGGLLAQRGRLGIPGDNSYLKNTITVTMVMMITTTMLMIVLSHVQVDLVFQVDRSVSVGMETFPSLFSYEYYDGGDDENDNDDNYLR